MVRERGERKKKEIMKAAAFLFREKGYTSTKMEDIGDAVGLLPPSLYRYFKSKEDLLRSVMVPSAEVGTEMIEEIAESAKSPTEKLREAFHVHLRLFDDYYPDMFVFAARNSDVLNASLSRHLQAIRIRYTEAWTTIIRSYIEDNPALSDLDPQIVCYAALGMCNWMYKWYAKTGRLSSSEIADQYFRIFAQNLVQ